MKHRIELLTIVAYAAIIVSGILLVIMYELDETRACRATHDWFYCVKNK